MKLKHILLTFAALIVIGILATIAFASPKPFKATATTSSKDFISMVPVQFTVTGSGGVTPYTYTWDFDSKDGQQVQKFERSPSFVFSTSGQFTVTATITDAAKSIAKSTIKVNISERSYKQSNPINLRNIHGTAENPVLIQGLDLTAVEGNAIEISDSSYITIEDNYIHDVSTFSPNNSEIGFGIFVKNSNHISIRRNKLINNSRSIYIQDDRRMDRCFQNEASDNFISGTQFSQGLMFRMCKGVTARNNILINNGEVKYFERNRITGIIAWDSSDIIMERNFVTGSSSDGLGVAVSNEEKVFDKNFASYNAKISYNVSVANGEQGIWIEGLSNGEIDHNYIVGNTNSDPRLGSSGIMLELENINLKIHDNFIKSNEISGISLHSSKNNEIYRNFISSNKGPGLSIENQQSNYFKETPSDNNYIHNNVITKNAYGVIVQNGTNNRFVNNTLSADFGDPFTIYKGVKSTLIVNNIINGAVNQQIYDLGTSTVIANNLLYGAANKSTSSAILKKSLISDPRFVNPKIDDFRLRSNSAAKSKANMKYSSCSSLPRSSIQKDLGAFCLPW